MVKKGLLDEFKSTLYDHCEDDWQPDFSEHYFPRQCCAAHNQPVSNGIDIALAAITYPTNTTSSGFYVTLPGLVNNVCSPAGSSCVRNVVISNQNMMTFNNLFFMPLKKGTDFIREIEVDIIDSSTGKTVDFKDGKLICTFLISYDI